MDLNSPAPVGTGSSTNIRLASLAIKGRCGKTQQLLIQEAKGDSHQGIHRNFVDSSPPAAYLAHTNPNRKAYIAG